MDEDGVDIDRAILRGLLKGLQRPLGVLTRLYVVLNCKFSSYEANADQ